MLYKYIEFYVGRPVDFKKEVVLQDDGDGGYIREWNIKGIAEPKIQDIESAFKEDEYEADILSQKEKPITTKITDINTEISEMKIRLTALEKA